MKTLIVYYSRTGTTKRAAEALASVLGADIEAIVDTADWSGLTGYLKAGRAGLKKTLTKIEETAKRPNDYDLVVLASPVWAGFMAAAVRTYIEKHKAVLPAVAMLVTQGAKSRQRIFDDAAAYVGKPFAAELFLTTKEVRQDQAAGKIKQFADRLCAPTA
jgi:flavodoxin